MPVGLKLPLDQTDRSQANAEYGEGFPEQPAREQVEPQEKEQLFQANRNREERERVVHPEVLADEQGWVAGRAEEKEVKGRGIKPPPAIDHPLGQGAGEQIVA